jgi:hypothetical protein
MAQAQPISNISHGCTYSQTQGCSRPEVKLRLSVTAPASARRWQQSRNEAIRRIVMLSDQVPPCIAAAHWKQVEVCAACMTCSAITSTSPTNNDIQRSSSIHRITETWHLRQAAAKAAAPKETTYCSTRLPNKQGSRPSTNASSGASNVAIIASIPLRQPSVWSPTPSQCTH